MKAYLGFFKRMLSPMAVLGLFLFLVGLGVGIYKTYYLESWETTRWEQFAGHPELTAIAAVLTLTGYFMMKRG